MNKSSSSRRSKSSSPAWTKPSANLKRVKANLKRYKAAVLKAAVDGKLTEGWRKLILIVEPAEMILKRMLVERKKKWTVEKPREEI